MILTPEIKWIDPPDGSPPQTMIDQAEGSALLAQALLRRGIATPELAKAFLDPLYYRPAAPTDLPDLDKGVERIRRAIQAQELIGVWGDFDVDGQTSTTLLVSVLRGLGARVCFHIPIRSKELHGITVPYLKDFLDTGVQVLLSCDTGVSAQPAVEYANNRGVEVVITDHHTLPDQLPPAYAIVNPQRLPEGHPLRTIPGAGTAYVFAEELCRRMDRPELAAAQLDLVALGTVADVATLSGDARYHVQLGLQRLRKAERLGLQKIYARAELDPSNMTEEQIGFMIGPRLNALGRLDDANPIVEFFTTSDSQKAEIFAAQLEGLNAHRRVLTDQIFKGALARLESEPGLLEQPVLVLDHPEWAAGVIGIVASRLVELYQRPVILLNSAPGGPVHGSARSIPGVNITQAIASAASLLNGYGGHPMAAGLSLQPEKLPAFRRQVCADVQRQMGATAPVNEIGIDAYLGFDQIGIDLVANIERLSPFGQGNPVVLLATRNLKVVDATRLGKNDDHLSVIVEDPAGNTRRVVWWNSSRDLLPEGPFDLAYTVRANNYRGQNEVQLEWHNARLLHPTQTNLATPLLTLNNVLDLRAEIDPQRVLALAGREESRCVWAEGVQRLDFPSATRQSLRPADNLVIWNPPPDQRLILNALRAVAPQRIILGCFALDKDQPRAFLEQLMGMVRFALRTQQGLVSLAGLAGALGQRETTIETGLGWVIARGYIRQVERDGGQFSLAEGGVPDKATLERLSTQLADELRETASFRAFYRRVDPAELFV